jgi:BirA family biotin operon repressor/biotin-[acetyl-CoA-carboxylase] ligase
LTTTQDFKKYGSVLHYLLQSPGRLISIDEITHRCGIAKKDVIAAEEHFAESGLEIKEEKGSIAVLEYPDSIVPSVIFCDLRSKLLGQEICSYKTIGSTNEVAKRLAESGAKEGAMVISDRQTRGRGRMGRSWFSPGAVGLYFSLVLRPRVKIARLPALSQVAALAICQIFERFYECRAMVKWPNDCVIGKKKVAGILLEMSAESERINYAILGIGINVNNDRAEFPGHLRSRSTSLAIETGKKQNRIAILNQFLLDFEKSYSNFQRYGLRFLGHELVTRSAILGKKVTVTMGRKRVNGTAIGIDEYGALRVRTKDRVMSIVAGEVTLR